VQKYELQDIPSWAPQDRARSVPEGLHLITLHQDQVIRAAPGSRVLAGNPFCPLGITTIGENALTIQAHPEMTRKLARTLYEELRSGEGDERTDRALQSLETQIDDQLAARWILAYMHYRQQGTG
jgi:GMP synthase-like glutamine amidotransferase